MCQCVQMETKCVVDVGDEGGGHGEVKRWNPKFDKLRIDISRWSASQHHAWTSQKKREIGRLSQERDPFHRAQAQHQTHNTQKWEQKTWTSSFFPKKIRKRIETSGNEVFIKFCWLVRTASSVCSLNILKEASVSLSCGTFVPFPFPLVSCGIPQCSASADLECNPFPWPLPFSWILLTEIPIIVVLLYQVILFPCSLPAFIGEICRSQELGLLCFSVFPFSPFSYSVLFEWYSDPVSLTLKLLPNKENLSRKRVRACGEKSLVVPLFWTQNTMSQHQCHSVIWIEQLF